MLRRLKARTTIAACALLFAACAADLVVGPAQTVQQPHRNCFLPEGSADAPLDTDLDDVCDDEDNCLLVVNPGQDDGDGDGVGDFCDLCEGDDATGDVDADGWCADLDCDDNLKPRNPGAPERCDGIDTDCDGIVPADEVDTDLDTIPDCADVCEGDDATGDFDHDGICGNLDLCRGDNSTGDTDADGTCDDLDLCLGNDATRDTDADGVCNDLDACDGDDAAGDTDEDGICDDIDECDGDDAAGDTDSDGFCDDIDCLPGDDASFPGGVEVCDGRDNDCDSIADDQPRTLCDDGETCAAGACTALRACYTDLDGDGHGDPADVTLVAPDVDCTTLGRVDEGDDCDDDPEACGADCGPDVVERCDGVDNDCNGTRDDGADALCDDPDGGSARCVAAACAVTCYPGFAPDGDAACVDIDECADTQLNDCAADADCTNADGSYACACRPGFVDPVGDGRDCSSVCGDGVQVDDEACDDGNTEPGDGCGPRCAVERGWACDVACATICGDGVIAGDEACDDANTDAGDGCSATCAVAEGWVCEGEPSVCASTARCGDGAIDAGERCDDGNTDAGDGCSPSCVLEAGWRCQGEPSVCEPPTPLDAGVDASADAAPDAIDDDVALGADSATDAWTDVDDGAPPASPGGCSAGPSMPSAGALGFAMLFLSLRKRRSESARDLP